jgi:hypothetical protein
MANTDFNTSHLNTEQRTIAEIILSRVSETIPDASGGGCPAFYTPEQWKERGEEYGVNSLLIICHDGGDLAPFFNWDYCEYNLVESMGEVLNGSGYFAEQCAAWYSAIYRR